MLSDDILVRRKIFQRGHLKEISQTDDFERFFTVGIVILNILRKNQNRTYRSINQIFDSYFRYQNFLSSSRIKAQIIEAHKFQAHMIEAHMIEAHKIQAHMIEAHMIEAHTTEAHTIEAHMFSKFSKLSKISYLKAPKCVFVSKKSRQMIKYTYTVFFQYHSTISC